jgi:PAS domain S-box-containing protein
VLFDQNIDWLELYKIIFEQFYYWLVVTDKDGIIVLMNKSYCEFNHVTQEEAIGKHVTEVIENTRMHIVAKTGIPEIGQVQEINGSHMLADRVPIHNKDGELIGVVGSVVFKDIADLDSYVKKVALMEKELEYFKKELKKARGTENTFDNIIGESQILKETKDLALKVAKSKSSVLILGESGTGKELYANAIHNASYRRDFEMVRLNCASIPHELLESELFGYEYGAFTGAKKEGKLGKIEIADKSTLFLDEIGDLPLTMQAKLLRFLQEKEIEKIGSTSIKKVDVRVIAATNKNLEEMIRNKTFREDLYYRLNIFKIEIPPLRERKTDIPILAKFLLRNKANEMDRYVTEFNDEAMRLLMDYNWPGNVRELENTIERAINLVGKEAAITKHHLPYHIREQKLDSYGYSKSESLKEMVAQLEIKEIKNALELSMGNKIHAAKILKISRTSLYEKMNRYQLEI